MKKGGHTHRLDMEDRMVIQACIAKGDGLGQIAARLKVHKSTVLREIARWSVRKQGADTPCSRRRLGVCNGCCKAPFCSLAKAYYDFRVADAASLEERSKSRSGTRLAPEEVALVDAIVSPRVRLGQSLHHIYASDPDLRASCSERTVRRLVNAGRLSAKAHELRRYATFPRKGPENRKTGQAAVAA